MATSKSLNKAFYISLAHLKVKCLSIGGGEQRCSKLHDLSLYYFPALSLNTAFEAEVTS